MRFLASPFKNIKIHSYVTSNGNLAFYECSSLTPIKFSIHSSVTSIGNSAFYRCSSLTQNTIPSSVKINEIKLNSNV